MFGIRRLRTGDAPYMLEWMHDPLVTEHMKADFKSKTVEDCLIFINKSAFDHDNIHMAIIDDEDEYLGTCSLKHINHELHSAEFAISLRSSAMGKGAASSAMDRLFDYGMKEYGIKMIYWCVTPENIRAIKLYDKKGTRIDIMKNERIYEETIISGYTQKEIHNFIWYIFS